MARAPKQFKSKAERLKHEAALERRRQKHHEYRTIQMAKQAAEGEADFERLLEAEKQRQRQAETHQQKIAAKGGAQSPKVTTQARDNLAAAFDLMGGVPALVVWGRSNKTEFYRLWARLIPREAAEATVSLPLEDLLAKLATKEAMSVGDAALQIGEEVMLDARKRAEAEDEPLLYKGESIQ